MKLEELTELYSLISGGIENIASRKQTMDLRKFGLKPIVAGTSLVKLAFDTRRVDQESEFISRRGLQNYHRSEQFISESIYQKIQAFGKLDKILDQLKLQFGKQPEWQDSYTRVLSSAIRKGLRTDQSDGDFSDSQPSMASLDYLEELLFVRYRLTPDSLNSMSSEDLRNVILCKDEFLMRMDSSVPLTTSQFEVKPSDVSKYSYDQMIEKMFTVISQAMLSVKPQQDDDLTTKLFNVKATKDAPEVERTVTITIKDKIADKSSKFEKIADEPVKEDIVTVLEN